MPKIRIGLWQMMTIVVNLLFGKAIGYTNEVLTRRVGNDAWLALVIGFLAGVPIIAATVWLASRYRDQGPEQYIPRLVGRWLGPVIMLILALYLSVAFITSAITIEQHVNDYLMVETPLWVFVVIYTALCAYGAHLGLEVVARLSVLGLGLTILLTVLMVMGSVDHMHPDWLLPLFDHGLPEVALASTAAHTDVAMVTLSLLFLLPRTERKGWFRYSIWGLAAGCALVLTWTIFELTVLGPEVTAQYLIACMQMARAAELSIYLHRYEMIMVVLFVYGVLTQSIVLLYTATEMTMAAIPWKKVSRGWVIAVVWLLLIYPNWWLAHDRDRYGLFLDGPWPAITGPVAFGLPLLLCAVALIRKRGQA